MSKKNLVVVFLVTLFYRLLFQFVNGFPLRPDFFQRTAIMKNIAAGEPYTQHLNPELFYQVGSLVYYLPVDPLWFFSIATVCIAALGITTIYYVTAEFFGKREGLYAVFALVVMSVIPFKSMYSWTINSYISAYIFLPLFLLTLFRWQRDENPIHLLSGSIVLLLIGGFHHLVFLETIALLVFAFFLVDHRVVLYFPALLLNLGLMWENYGRYISERALSLTTSIAEQLRTFLPLAEESSPPSDGGSGTPSPSTGERRTSAQPDGNKADPIAQFADSMLLNVLSLLSTLNPFVILTGCVGFTYSNERSCEKFGTSLRILLAWVLAQIGMILFTYFVQPNGTERTIRHLYIPFAMVFGVGFEAVLAVVEQRLNSLDFPARINVRRTILVIALILSVPMLVYQIAPFGGAGYVVHPDSEITDGLQHMEVEGTILAPPLTNEVVNYYHNGPVFRTYPRDFPIPDRVQQTQAQAWEWWENPSKCKKIQNLGIDWVFVDKRNYADQYWNNPKNIRVPQRFDQPYLEVKYENTKMALYEVTACRQ